MVLYLPMGHSVTYQWYADAAFLLTFTYCLNNTLVIISAVASPSTQNHLQQTFYAVRDVERKAEEPIGSGVTAPRLETSPEYITTTHGILTALETLGAAAVMVLYQLMGHSVTYKWYAHAVFLLAFTYCLNNTLVIISAVASPSTQNHLQQTLYYSLYHCTAGLLYLVGCAVFYGVDRGDGLRFRNTTAAVGDVERKAEEPIGSGVTAMRLEPSPEYITTTHGILTALETFGAAAVMVLYLLMGHSVTWYAHAAFLLAFTYCLNNTLVFISAVASPSTQNHLQQTLYYSLYHCMAGLLFLVGCAVFYGVDRGDSLRFRNITATALLGIGLLHVRHGLTPCSERFPDCSLVGRDHAPPLIGLLHRDSAPQPLNTFLCLSS
ncbi:hypothetical protein MRX96_048687 [Rhipicephalus microplus]